MKESKKSNMTAIPFVSREQQTAETQEQQILAELEARVARLDLPRREVPAALDQAILDYAVQVQKKRSAVRTNIHFIRKYALGLAAALAVCVSLSFLLKDRVISQQVTTLAGAPGPGYLADDQESMNMELFLLSSSIRNSSERLTRTAAFSAALDIPK